MTLATPYDPVSSNAAYDASVDPADRMVVAMSGGVDSSVAAALLAEEGRQVVGVTMHLAGEASRCCSLEDADDARRVAQRLGIRFFVANYSERFRKEVIESFADDYLAGRTPIPCVLCNSRFKFEYLMNRADVFGARNVATGHYARIQHDEQTGRLRLYRARYKRKDQTYFLFQLNQDQLSRIRFPLADMTKQEVREHARKLGLETAEKSESQEICFVPNGDYAAVVEEIRPAARRQQGDFVDEAGRVVGRHRGVHHFTVGQRHGLGISDANRALYVSRIDAPNQRVHVGEAQRLDVKGAVVDRFSWIAGEAPVDGTRARVQIRYRDPGTIARIASTSEGRVELRFDQSVRAVTPGQAAVLYDAETNEEVLGGGWIAGALT